MSSHLYSLSDRWLHWLALEPGIVRQLSFDLERQYALPKRPKRASADAAAPGDRDPAGRAVYVCGLARSGTTLLLHLLDQVDDFRSLTYRDMPFPLAPNLWRRVASLARKDAVAAPRAHGDGMLVDYDSPEGFEEVFWRTFTRYSTRDGCLAAERPSAEALETFADYRALVANPRGQVGDGTLRRYLSKNNNNLLRLAPLCAQADSQVVLVYRHPAAAARSMLRTHIAFREQQGRDDYMRRYMNWLGHHEFGVGHLPFKFAVPSMDNRHRPEQLDYWLDYWCAVHEHILATQGPALHLLDYDALCRSPAQTLNALFHVLGIRKDGAAFASQITPPAPAAEQDFDHALLQRAQGLHRAFRARTENCNGIVDA